MNGRAGLDLGALPPAVVLLLFAPPLGLSLLNCEMGGIQVADFGTLSLHQAGPQGGLGTPPTVTSGQGQTHSVPPSRSPSRVAEVGQRDPWLPSACLPVAGSAQLASPPWGPEVLRFCQLTALGRQGRPAPVGKATHWPHIGRWQGQGLGESCQQALQLPRRTGVAWLLLLHPKACGNL